LLATPRLRATALYSLVLLLQACASLPGEDPAGDGGAEPQPEPELTLHLPDQNCRCDTQGAVDYTFLDKGFSALAAGDHVEAVEYFQRYQRLEASAEAQWEAQIAIAYDSMLPQSPFYDPRAAALSFEQLSGAAVDVARVHRGILLMHHALAVLADLQTKSAALERDNRRLAEELALREEAIRRLRELTLGQKAGSP